MWRCFVRDQARVPSVAGAGSSLFRIRNSFFKEKDNPREGEREIFINQHSFSWEGWEDGTPLPHRDFKERGVIRCDALAVTHPWASASSYLRSKGKKERKKTDKPREGWEKERKKTDNPREGWEP